MSIVTGVAAYDFMCRMADLVMDKLPHVSIDVHRVTNVYFGDRITVAGLLTGQDVINALKGKELGQCLLMASVMFKSDEPVMLDDIHVDEVKKELNTQVEIVEVNGKAFLDRFIR